MKVHEYNEMMRWLTRPKVDPRDAQLAASLPYGTQGTYDAPEPTDMPNWRDLIREEGVQVGPQVKDGGRIEMKPGGLVEPGVTHYAKKKPWEKAKYVSPRKYTWVAKGGRVGMGKGGLAKILGV